MGQTTRVEICNIAGGDSRMTRWRHTVNGWEPSGAAIRHYRRLGHWADVRPLTDTIGPDAAMRILDRAVGDLEGVS